MHNLFEAKGWKLKAHRAESRGQRAPSQPAARGLGSTKAPPVGSGPKPRPQMHFGVFWAWKSHLVATFSIIYFSWKSGNDALWCILKYAYTSSVPNNWKPPKIPDFGMNWNRTIRSCHKFLKMCAWNIKRANFLKSTVASHVGHRSAQHMARGPYVVHSCNTVL